MTTSAMNALYEGYVEDADSGLEPLLNAVRRTALRIMPDEDSVQDFLVDLWQVLVALPPDLSFGGWVLTRMRWRSLDRRRKLRHLTEHELQPPEMLDEDEQPIPAEDVLAILNLRYAESQPIDPEPDLDAIDDPFIRSAAELLLRGMTQDEVARKLGLKPSTFRQRLRRYRLAQEPELIAA